MADAQCPMTSDQESMTDGGRMMFYRSHYLVGTSEIGHWSWIIGRWSSAIPNPPFSLEASHEELSMDLVRVTEAAVIAASAWIGTVRNSRRIRPPPGRP